MNNKNNTYLLDISPLFDEEMFNKYYENLTNIEKEKISSYVNFADKVRSLGARVLIHKVFSIYKIDVEKIKYSEFNKPYIEGNKIYFNISHSGNFVVLSISNKEVGVDIQQYKNINENIKNKILTKEELDFYRKLYLKDKYLLDTFSLKEAITKCLGNPYTILFNELNIDKDKNFILYNNEKIYFKQYDLEGYAFFVASRNKTFNSEILKITLD